MFQPFNIALQHHEKSMQRIKYKQSSNSARQYWPTSNVMQFDLQQQASTTRYQIEGMLNVLFDFIASQPLACN